MATQSTSRDKISNAGFGTRPKLPNLTTLDTVPTGDTEALRHGRVETCWMVARERLGVEVALDLRIQLLDQLIQLGHLSTSTTDVQYYPF